MSEVRRKHFRFPAYGDEEGVKLVSHESRVLFEQDRGLSRTQDQGFSETQAPKKQPERSLRRNPAANGHAAGKKSYGSSRELPDYRSHKGSQTVTRSNLFGERHKNSERSHDSLSESRTMTNASSLKSNQRPNDRQRQRTYFVPKYVPASILPDEPKEEVSRDELMASMQKPTTSYLLFDTEPTAYQEKKIDEPSVKTFKKPASAVPKDEEEDVPAIVRKNGKKGRAILDRSLSGLIAEGKAPENSYFK